MTVYVFCGPTLSADEGRAELDAVFLPPAAEGDVYRAARTRPSAIGIIDGYFERVPAVWHKEILWAMKEGVHVYGSASMGALRAAELAAFGMVGVGSVFEAYRDGALEDDDEVTVAHAPAEAGYASLSEAMVDIRATVAAAVEAGVIDTTTWARLVGLAKSLFYPDRSWPLLLQLAADANVPGDQLAGLSAWLPRGRVRQKRADALAMLQLMRSRLEADRTPKRVTYHFEHTDLWEEARAQACLVGGQRDEPIRLADLLEELRLDGRYPVVLEAALLRVLARGESRRLGLRVSAEMRQQTFAVLSGRRMGMAPADRKLLDDESCVQWVSLVLASEVLDQLPAQVRLLADIADLHQRALYKRQALASRGLEEPSLADVGLTDEELHTWWFEDQHGGAVPDDVAAFALATGFDDPDTFRRALLREYCAVRVRLTR